MRLTSRQHSRSLLITCVPYMTLTNRLPCAFNFRITVSDQVENRFIDPECTDLTSALALLYNFVIHLVLALH